MQAILDFLVGFAETIGKVIDFVIGFFEDIVYLIQLTGTFLAQIPSYFSWMPEGFAAMIGIIFTVVVLYKVLGREG